MKTYRESAKAWGEAYKARERSITMGRAMSLADDVFEAVALAADPGNGLPGQRAILAGAIVSIQEQARADVRAEILAEARSLVAGEIRVAVATLEKWAAAVEGGRPFLESTRV